MKYRSRGITLIELMIVVAIVGILASIAYPSYRDQVRASKRADATGALMGLAGGMERFFTENGTYAGATAAGVYFDQSPIDGGTPAYNLAVTASSATTYTITATPIGDQAGDKCSNLTLTNTGVKGIAGGVTVEECWR